MTDECRQENISVDIYNIEKIANIIKEETDGFFAELKMLEKSICKLEKLISNTNAEYCCNKFNIDFNKLKDLYNVFFRLSDDYFYAIERYRRADQKSYEILNAINDI